MIKALTFIALSIASLVVYSQCRVPETLENVTVVGLIDPVYSVSNPNAGAIISVTYTKDKYHVVFLNRQTKPFEGSYSYRVLDAVNGVGLFLGDEVAPLNKPSHTILFKCLTDTYGTAIFTQLAGEHEPSPRQNTTTYTLQ